MNQFDKSASFAEASKEIASFMSRVLEPLGYKKRRNGFNRRLENGLIHQISLVSIGAYSYNHGKFYVHAGCYVPEAELYRTNTNDPKWVPDYLCAIRGQFPEVPMSIRNVASNPNLVTPHLDIALRALADFENYDLIISDTAKGGQSYFANPKAALEEPVFSFETPQPILKSCVLLTRGDREGAAKTLRQYLAALQKTENPHLGHIEVVSKWAIGQGL